MLIVVYVCMRISTVGLFDRFIGGHGQAGSHDADGLVTALNCLQDWNELEAKMKW